MSESSVCVGALVSSGLPELAVELLRSSFDIRDAAAQVRLLL